MQSDGSSKSSQKKQRLWHFLKKVIIWSVVLYALDGIFKYVGWTSWEKFDASSKYLTHELMVKMERISPIALYRDLRYDRQILVRDTAAMNEVDRQNAIRHNMIIRGDNILDIPPQKFYPHATYHKLTIWQKVKEWCSGFWYKDDQTPNWFGRIVLLIAILFAIPLSRAGPENKNQQSWNIGWFLINILLGLFYLTLFSMFLYVFMKVILFIAGSLIALFTGLTTMFGFSKYILSELKSEVVDNSKKGIPPFITTLLHKK